MVDIQAIEKAREMIQPFINETPLHFSDYLSNYCSGQISLKLENQQITNSFKIRGALNKMLSLSTEEKEKGVLAVSSGNHAQAVGAVAEQLGITAKIIIPNSTPQNKISKIKNYQVELILEGNNYDEAEVYARNLAKEESATFVSGYNITTPIIIANKTGGHNSETTGVGHKLRPVSNQATRGNFKFDTNTVCTCILN